MPNVRAHQKRTNEDACREPIATNTYICIYARMANAMLLALSLA